MKLFTKLHRALLLPAIVTAALSVGCGDDGGDTGVTGGSAVDTGLIGLWEGASDDGMAPTIRFNSDNTVELAFNGYPGYKGIFTTTGNKLTITFTHVNYSTNGLTPNWYTENEYKTILINMGITEDMYEQTIGTVFKPINMTYYINDNTVTTLGENGSTDVFTRVSDNPGTSGGSGTPSNNGGIKLGSEDAVPAGAIKIASFADLCKIGKETAYPLNGTYELTGPTVSIPLNKRAATVFNGNTFNASAPPMSTEEMERKARAEQEKMLAETVLHNAGGR
jgi:hypothetical protein